MALTARIVGRLIRHAPAANYGAPGCRVMRATLARFDAEDGGAHDIRIDVRLDDFPVFRRVRLLDARSGRLVREAWADGECVFHDMKDGIYDAVAFDHTGVFHPVARRVAAFAARLDWRSSTSPRILVAQPCDIVPRLIGRSDHNRAYASVTAYNGDPDLCGSVNFGGSIFKPIGD